MNIYVPKKFVNLFTEKLKEIQEIDDFILDRIRFGKQKINVLSKTEPFLLIKAIIEILPENSMVVNELEYPGKEYVLCVGDVSFSDLSYLKEQDLTFSIITKKSNSIRFNTWIPVEKVENIFHSNKVKNFSSINGKIENESYFVFESQKQDFDQLFENISSVSDKYIIKDKKIYVKLLLQDFTNLVNKLNYQYKKIEIIDPESL